MSRFISISEYAPRPASLLILACIEALGANSGANQLPKGWDKRPHLSSSRTHPKIRINLRSSVRHALRKAETGARSMTIILRRHMATAD
jgi:hypothetical protein